MLIQLAKGDVLSPKCGYIYSVSRLHVSDEKLQLHHIGHELVRIKAAINPKHLVIGRKTKAPLLRKCKSVHKYVEELTNLHGTGIWKAPLPSDAGASTVPKRLEKSTPLSRLRHADDETTEKADGKWHPKRVNGKPPRSGKPACEKTDAELKTDDDVS
jgi:hypothetical protein